MGLLSRDNLRLMKVGSRKIISVHSNNCKLLPARHQLLRFNDIQNLQLNPPSTIIDDLNNRNTPTDPFHYSTSLARNLAVPPPSGGDTHTQAPHVPAQTPPDQHSDKEFYTGSEDSIPELERTYDPDDTILGYEDQGSPDTTDPESSDTPSAPPNPVTAPEAGASTSGAMTRTRAKREQFVPEQLEYSKTSL